jgi:DNA-binding transcriptional LysR family regulator
VTEPHFAEVTTLVAVIEHKRFANAAKQLELSPPRVSEMVRNLEERLGVRLVERTTRSVSPTEAGERLLLRLRPILNEYQAALESMNDFRAKPAGTLRLSVAPAAADLVLSSVIPRFLVLYPEINLDICIEPHQTDIVAQRFDAGIRPGERIEKDMITVRVSGELPMVVVGAPSYIAQHGVPKTPKDLLNHNCIRFRAPNGSLFPWRFGKDGQVFEANVKGSLAINDAALAQRSVVDGVGLLYTALPYAASDLAKGRVVSLLTEWTAPSLAGLFLYYPSRRQIRPPLKALIDFLRKAHHQNSARDKPVTRNSTANAFPASMELESDAWQH